MLGFLEMSREEKVAVFNKAAGKKPYDVASKDFESSYVKGFVEEAEELLEAVQDYWLDPSEENRAQLCKEWADTQITLSNIAWYLNIPADPSVNRVHNSNMTKIGPDGQVILREDGKILKPASYAAPDMKGL